MHNIFYKLFKLDKSKIIAYKTLLLLIGDNITFCLHIHIGFYEKKIYQTTQRAKCNGRPTKIHLKILNNVIENISNHHNSNV